MSLSIVELARAREATGELLDELGLEAYLFELDPHGEQWQLKVDCAIGAQGAWESHTLSTPKESLLRSHDDAAMRRRILTEWRGQLSACKMRQSR